MPAAAARMSAARHAGTVEHQGRTARAPSRARSRRARRRRAGCSPRRGSALARGDRHPDVAVTEVEAGDEAVRPVQRQERRRPPAARSGAAASGRRLVDQALAEQLGDERGRRAPRQPDRARELRPADRAVVADHRDQMGAEQRVRRCRGDLGVRGLGHARRLPEIEAFWLAAGRNRRTFRALTRHARGVSVPTASSSPLLATTRSNPLGRGHTVQRTLRTSCKPPS